MKAQSHRKKPSLRGKPSPGKQVASLDPEHFVDIIEHISDGLIVLDKDWHFAYLNQKAATMLQHQSPAELIGKHIWTEYPEGVGQPFQLAYEQAMRDQVPLVVENHYEPWDLWFENRIYPSPDHLTILFTEITDRKRIESLLNDRQYFLQKILDTEPGTVYIYDLEERRNVYVNRYWLLTYGYTEEETRAMGDELLVRIAHPEDLARIAKHHEEWSRAEPDEIREVEFRIRTKSGEWQWLHSHEAVFTRNDAGRVKQILGIMYEITARKFAQEALRESEEKFSRVFHASPIPLSISRVSDGRYIEVNDSFVSRLGFRREEVIGQNAESLEIWAHPEGRRIMMQILQEKGSLRNFETQFRTRSGETGTALVFRDVIELAGEQYLIGTSLDITERKEMERAILKERDFSDAMLNSLPGVFYFYDQAGTFLRWNRNFEIVTGYSAEQIAQMHPLDFFLGAEKDHIAQKIRQVFEVGGAEVEANLVTRFGDLFPYYFTGRRIEIDGQPYLIGMGIDITQRVIAERELRKLNLELEERIADRTRELATAMVRAQESDRLKSAFLAAMSHELRTPLNSIIGFTGVILQGLAGPLTEEQTRQLNMVRDSSRHLLALINDVLDISKIEAGQLEILKRPFDMRQAIESALRVVQPLAHKKDLQLRMSIGPGVGLLNNDRRRVEQVLINLINNAVKFTERGRVWVDCQVHDGWLETCVRDEGIGIKPEQMDKLFKPFQQLDTGLARGHEGTGLGLSICERLVSAMGGEIRVESQWGLGSTFTFTLPL